KDEISPVFADLTFGAGGHTFKLLSEKPNAKVIACDQDPDAFENGADLIKNSNLQEKIELLNINFCELPTLLEKRQIKLDGIIADLGVSSHQFDKEERGFSFRKDAPLDMRMNYKNDESNTGAVIVNSYTQDELMKIFFDF